MNPDQLQFIKVDDFSPGIISRTGVRGSVGAAPSRGAGAATAQNTYRCIALPSGGLGPLPRQTTPLRFTDHATANIPGGVTAVVTGFCLMGPMYKSVGSVNAPPYLQATPYEIHLGYEYISGGVQVQVWRKYPYYSGDASVVLKTTALTPTNRFSATYFAIGRMNPTNPTFAGFPVVCASWNQFIDPVGAGDWNLAYPDPTSFVTSQTDVPAVIFGGNIGGPLIAHQERIVGLIRGAANHGANKGVVPIDEYIYYTAPNDIAVDAGSITFGQEYPTGYGAWGSLTASDLLLIKHYGGAYLVQGDLNSPIVRRLPNVVSTGGIESLGANSPIGFVYGVNGGGVYVWSGGDGSDLLSPQLEDGFWQATSPLYNFAGKFLSWGDLIFSPNNYVYSTSSKSWWLIDDPTAVIYNSWQKDPMNDVVYGSVPTFTSAVTQYATAYDSSLPALSYSWQSQPFFISEGRLGEIRELLLVAQGTGTVTVTITSLDSGATFTKALNVASTSPAYSRVNVRLTGSKFQMRLVSAGGGAAPIVHEYSLGYIPGRMMAVTP